MTRASVHRCRICRCTKPRTGWAERGRCLICAALQDTIAALCALRQRRWRELLEHVARNVARVVDEQLAVRRVRRALWDLLGSGVIEMMPGSYYLTPAPPAWRA